MSKTKIKAFLSHSTIDKEYATDLKNKLDEYEIDVFVAHEDMSIGEDFSERLFDELQQSDIFFMLLSENFSASKYTDQETGIAINLGIPIFPICIDETIPYGFVSKLNGLKCSVPFERQKIEKIIETINNTSIPEPKKLDELIEELRNAPTYSEAASLANVVARYSSFSEEQINSLATAYLGNPEIYGSYIASPLIRRILKNNIEKLNPKLKQMFGT